MRTAAGWRRLATLVAMAGAFGDGQPRPASAEDPAGPAAAPPVSVMSFNIRYGTAADGVNAWPGRRERVIACIRRIDPDLLGTQEMLAFQRDELAAGLPGHAAVAVGRDDGLDAGEMAGIFYREDRFRRIAAGHFWLSSTPEIIGSRGWDAALPRIATWVRLEDRRQPDAPDLLFLNTHLDHRGGEARLESARLIRRWLTAEAADCRVIFCGDFNADEGSEPYAALFAAGAAAAGLRPLVDTLRAVRPERAAAEGTFTGFEAGRVGGPRIDWIGCSPDWSVRAAAIDRSSSDGRTPSDHAAVTAVLTGADVAAGPRGTP